MSDVKSGSQKTKSQHSKSRPSIPESYTAFAKDVIFYANDEIIEKFVEYRRYSQLVEAGPNEKTKLLFIIAELILLMRKDLGYSSDVVTVDDFMYILINDWGTQKDSFHEKAEQAIKIN